MNFREKQSIRRNMIFNATGTLIYSVCQWLMSVIIVRLSGYADAGVLAVAASVTASPAIVGLFNIRSFQVSDLEGQFSDYVYIRSRMVTNLTSFLVCAVMVFTGGYDFEKVVVIFVYMAYKLIEGYADVYYGIEQKWNRMDYIGISMSVRGVGGILLFVLAFCMTGSLCISVGVMAVFSLTVIVLFDKRIVWKRGTVEKKAYFSDVKRLLMTCFPLAIVAFLNNLSINLPKIFLERYHGAEIMGYYGSVSSPSVVVQLAATTIFAPLVTVLAMAYANGEKKRFLQVLKRYFIIVIALSIMCLIGAYIFGEWALVLLFKEGIRTYAYLLLPIIIVSFFTAVNANLFSVCTLLREIKIQYVVGILGIVSSLLFSVFIVKAMSINGVVYATIGTMVVQILIQIAIIKRGLEKI